MKYALVTIALLFALASHAEDRAWERVIQKFEQTDAETPPPEKPILFTGSSSIVLWKVDEAYPKLPVLNRGFGGSNFADLNYFFDRVVKRYDPSIIVVYSGDNDIASGQTAEEVYAEFEKFAGRVREALPDTRLVALAIKPSRARWALYPEAQKVNAQMKEYADKQELVAFVDLGASLLGEDGEPKDELFTGDRLHLNKEGYKVWTEKFRPVLEKLATDGKGEAPAGKGPAVRP